MRNRLVFVALVLLVASADWPRPFDGRLTAQVLPPLVPRPIFDNIPPPGTPATLAAFSPLGSPMNVADHTLAISHEGKIYFLDPRTGNTVGEVALYAGAPDPITFSMGFVRATPGVTRPDFMIAGPFNPSPLPIGLFSLTTMPPALLGETPDPNTQAGGFRVDIGDVDADAASEVIVAAGPGAPPIVNILVPGSNAMTSFLAFDPAFRGGVWVATGDLNGDGKHEIITSQESGGGQIKAFGVVGGQVQELGSGFPYPPPYTGGVRVAAGDVDGDGRADIVTVPRYPDGFLARALRALCLNGPPGATPIGEVNVFDQSITGEMFVDIGAAGGRPFIMVTSGNQVKKLEATTQGIRSVDDFIQSVINRQVYANIPTIVNAGGGQIRSIPLHK